MSVGQFERSADVAEVRIRPVPFDAIPDECGSCEIFVDVLVDRREPLDLSLDGLRDLAGEFYYRPRYLRRVRGVIVWNGCEDCLGPEGGEW